MRAEPVHPELDVPEAERADPRLFEDVTLSALNWALLSAGVVFGAALFTFWRLQVRVPAGERLGGALPVHVWLIGALLFALDLACSRARVAIAREDAAGSARALAFAFLFGVLELGVTVLLWRDFEAKHLVTRLGVYTLSGLHALGVAVGLLVLACVWRRTRRGRYWSLFDTGIRVASRYGRFLHASWWAIVAELYFVF